MLAPMEAVSVLKLLIDENLSPTLVELANAQGFVCSHVSRLGLSGKKDWQLKDTILEGDWTFVTANSIDFRGPVNDPGHSGEYKDFQLHAGLICINAGRGLNRAEQRALMMIVLAYLNRLNDLTNEVLEVDVDARNKITLRRYKLPPNDRL